MVKTHRSIRPSRVRNTPPRSPVAQQAKDLGAFKDSPAKLAFYIDYSNAIYAGEIRQGVRSSKEKTAELAAKHSVLHPKQYFKTLQNAH